MKRRFGDRKDGYLLRKIDPFFRLIPFLMKERNDAQVFFEDRIYLDETNELIRELRKEGYRLGFLHVVIASMVRVMSQRPKINRFVRGKKIYARNEISFSLAVKKEMNEHAEETTIKIIFEPTDTLYDVIEKVNREIEANKVVDSNNDTDGFVKLITKLPNFILSFAVKCILVLDNKGWLPRFITNLSPFHSSVFITDLGSIGIRPVFHHIYNIGTNSVFVAFGTKSREQFVEQDLDQNVEVSSKRAMDIKVVVDERIVDGFYFASAMKLMKRNMQKPSILLTPPENVVIDDQI